MRPAPVQGDYSRETVFSDDPVDVARRWVEQGADRLHLVDLDGAKAGRPVNGPVIRRIVEAVSVPCQLGGGIRTEDHLGEVLAWGVRWAVLGTKALQDPAWVRSAAEQHPGRIVLGLDARDGLVATDGWLNTSQVKATDLAKQVEDAPLAAVVYTDIARDGMMSGPNYRRPGGDAGGHPAARDRLRRGVEPGAGSPAGGGRHVRLHRRPGAVRRFDFIIRGFGPGAGNAPGGDSPDAHDLTATPDGRCRVAPPSHHLPGVARRRHRVAGPHFTRREVAMGRHLVEDIRNIALVGHRAAGKTTLADALLFEANAVDRLGSVDDGTSVSDRDEDEQRHHFSIDTSVLHLEHDGKYLHLLDAPGTPDFVGAALEALSAVETAVIVVSAVNGIEVNTRRMFNEAGRARPRPG